MTTDLLYLSRQNVESLQIPMGAIVEALEDVFVEKGNGRVEMPPKPGIHPAPDAFIHAMPAYVSKIAAAGVKWVSGFPQNMQKNLPYISGLLILNDPETGFPTCIMDCTWITAKRTGAATAVAAKHLARKESSTVAILGCGVQGYSNLEALKFVFPKIASVRAYDINATSLSGFCRNVFQDWKLKCHPCASPKEACEGADIIVTAGPILKDPSPVIEESWIKEGAFLSPVDFDSYLKPEVFDRATKIFTDDLAQQRYYHSIGYFKQTPTPHGDLGELLAGKKRGRENSAEVTIALNLGIALEDMATAILVYREAKSRRVGTSLPS